MSSPGLNNQVLLQVPLSAAPQPDLLMGKVVMVSQDGVGPGGVTAGAVSEVPLPVELQKSEREPQQREILVNVVSTGAGTDFIVLRPEDLPGSAAPQTPDLVTKGQRFYSTPSRSGIRSDMALQGEVGIGGGNSWVNSNTCEHAKLVSHLGLPEQNVRRASLTSDAGPGPVNIGVGRYCTSNIALDGVYAGSTVVERPQLQASEAAGVQRDTPVLVRPVDGKPVETVPVATVDAYPIRPYVRGLVELPAFDEGYRQRSHWGQYSHLSPREKNRQAQRRFRERQKSRVLSLQKEVQRLNAENACLRSDLSKSQADKERLVQVVSNLMQRLDKDQGKDERN